MDVKVEVEMKNLFFCSQCDFDSENENDLKTHITKNIHDVQNVNRTFQETVEEKKKEQKKSLYLFSCHICSYETSDLRNLDEHGVKNHGFVNCDKCDFSAEDRNILEIHMRKHTGGQIYTCFICEFEATRQCMLDDHIESKHGNNKPWWNEVEQTCHFCERCEKTFQHLFVKRYHK